VSMVSPGLRSQSAGLSNGSPGLSNGSPGLSNGSPSLSNGSPDLSNGSEGSGKVSLFEKYGREAREAINALLKKYADVGICSIEDLGILKVQPFNRFGSPLEVVKLFQGKPNYLKALQKLEELLYDVA
ncbi:MAG: hypothetical protein GY940_20730, partial [bacterium]|nr:hypothetical protein [bacterium]